MSVIATEGYRYSDLVKAELWKELGYTKLEVTVNEAAAKDYVVGNIVGKVTATGKYKLAVETAADGSKVFGGLVLENKAIAASTDTKLIVMVKGPASVAKAGIVFDATYNDATKKGVIYTAMETAGIQLLETTAV